MVLRGRLRRPDDELGVRARTLVRLQRGGDGVYRGSFVWPDSAVLGVFAVEDSAGGHIDTNERRYWELSAGVRTPSFPALRQRVFDRADPTRRDWTGSLSAARELAAAYPDSAQSWFLLAATQRNVLGPTRPDSLRRRIIDRLRLLDARNRRAAPSEATAEALYRVAEEQDSAVAAHWRAYLVERFPDGTVATEVRRAALFARVGGDARAALPTFDSLWEREPSRWVASGGYVGARMSRDSALLRRWAERWVGLSSAGRVNIARDLIAYPTLRAAGVRLLEEALAGAQADSIERRGLDQSSDAYAAGRSLRRATIVATLAGAALLDGDSARADSLYSAVAARSWSPRLLRAAADLELVRGDTAAALVLYSRVAVIPPEAVAFVGTLRDRIQGLDARPEWRDALATARQEFDARVRRREIEIRLGPQLALRTSDGRRVTIGEIAAGRPLVLAFWSPECQPSVRALAGIKTLREYVERHGGHAVLVVDAEPTPALRALVAQQPLAAGSYFRDGTALRLALGQWMTPDLYVLDRSGVVRFAHSSPDDASGEFRLVAEEGRR